MLESDFPVIFFTQKEKHHSQHAERKHICNLTQIATDHNYVQLQAAQKAQRKMSGGVKEVAIEMQMEINSDEIHAGWHWELPTLQTEHRRAAEKSVGATCSLKMGEKCLQFFRNKEKDTSLFDDDVPGCFVKDHLVEDVDDLTHKLIVLLLS